MCQRSQEGMERSLRRDVWLELEGMEPSMEPSVMSGGRGKKGKGGGLGGGEGGVRNEDAL
jgi:hypothetical protein